MTPPLGGKRAERKSLESVTPVRSTRAEVIAAIRHLRSEARRVDFTNDCDWVFSDTPEGFLDDKPHGWWTVGGIRDYGRYSRTPNHEPDSEQR